MVLKYYINELRSEKLYLITCAACENRSAHADAQSNQSSLDALRMTKDQRVLRADSVGCSSKTELSVYYAYISLGTFATLHHKLFCWYKLEWAETLLAKLRKFLTH